MKELLQLSSRRYVLIWGVLTFIGTFFLLCFNATVDPYWMRDHVSVLNRIQPIPDERMVKSNFLAFNRGKINFDSVLLGSSRAAALDTGKIPGLAVFNYSVNNMVPLEYPEYVDFFSSIAGHPKVIFLAVDFFGTRYPDYYDYRPPEYYLKSIGGFKNRIVQLSSFDCLESSIETVQLNFSRVAADDRHYDRQLKIRIEPVVSNDACLENVTSQLPLYRDAIYGGDYVYNEQNEVALRLLTSKYPNSTFIVFTTPPTTVLQRVLVETGRLPDYEKWIRMLVSVFGSIYDFTGVNKFSSDLNNYRDAHHFTTIAGDVILHDLLADQPEIARVVTSANIEEHLSEQRRSLLELCSKTGAVNE